MVLESGKPYTNKKMLSVEFQNLYGTYLKMRLSVNKEMNDIDNPWVDYTKKTTFDFGDQWALNGLQDGAKIIYAELLEVSEAVVPLSAKIGLDTLPPQGNLKGILSQGLGGKLLSTGQKENISWQINDTPSAQNYSTGIAENGLSLSLSSQPDCSSNSMTSILKNNAYKDSYELSWPNKLPNEAFYVCLTVSDRTGNTLSLMSQPLINLWRVFAGDNTQGNGGSINSQNVRFQYPALIAKNSKNETYIYDSQFNNIRKVSDSGIITLVAGNGPSAAITENIDAQLSALPFLYGMSLDSNDNLYVSNSWGVFKLETASGLPKWVKKIASPITASCRNTMDILKVAGSSDQLYLHSACSQKTSDPDTKALAYVYKLNLNSLDTTPVTTAAQLSTFRILGNGKISERTTKPPRGFVTGVSSDVTNLNHSVDYPSAIKVRANGDIIVNGIGEYNTNVDGRSLVVYFKKINATQFERYELGTFHNATQIDLAPYQQTSVDYLAIFIGSRDRPMNLVTVRLSDLSDVKMQSLSPVKDASTTNPWILGVLINQFDATKPYGVSSLMLTATANSQIFITKSTATNSFEVQSIWGRDYTTDKSSVATEMFLPNPTGIAQSVDGNTYIFDRLNSSVRKVDSAGSMSYFLGNPKTPVSSFFTNVDFKDVKFNGAIHPTEQFDLLIDESSTSKKLFMSIGGYYLTSKSINVFDLNSQKANSILTSAVGRSFANTATWGMAQMEMTPSGRLFTARNYIETNTTLGAAPTAVITEVLPANTQAILVGKAIPPTSEPVSNVLVKDQSFQLINAMTSVELKKSATVTSEVLFFQSAYGSKLQLGMTTLNDTAPKYVKIVAPTMTTTLKSLKAIRLGSTDYLLGASNSAVWIAEIPSAFLTATAPALEFKKLCIPGTFLNNSKYMTVSRNSNILISDENNGRVLEYFLHDVGGTPILVTEDQPACSGI